MTDMNKRREFTAPNLAVVRAHQIKRGYQAQDGSFSMLVSYHSEGYADGFYDGQSEMQAQTQNALKFLRQRVVGFQASRNVFRIIDEEIKKYDQNYESQISSRQRKQFVADRNDLIQELRKENSTLKAQLELAVKVITERCCIDDCGFDVREEPREVLEACMIVIDFECREALDKINQLDKSENTK